MENNKTYLQRLPWVALLGLAHTLIMFVIFPMLFDSSDRSQDSIRTIIYLLIPITYFIALGIVTSNWKAAGIAAGAYVVLQLLNWFVITEAFRNEGSGFSTTRQLLMYLLYPVPFFVFAAVHTGLTKRLWLVYVLLFFFSLAFSLDSTYINGRNFLAIIDDFEWREGWGIAITIFSILVRIAFYITEIIVICEVLNIGLGKTYTNKPTLLNLGNDYDKGSNIIAFWSLKLSLFVVILASAASFAGLLASMDEDYGYMRNDDFRQYLLYMSFFRLLGYTALALFLGWYIRKFLLETFMNFGIHSKFLYWFCFIPVLGFFGFLVIQLENMKQEKYSQKVQSLGTFAASSNAGVTGVIFFLMGIRLIIELVDGNAVFIVSALLGAGLFVWLISSKVGYQVSIWMVGSVLFLLLVIGLTSGADRYREQELYSVMFALLLANLVSLVFIYPVYHFEDFQYMPSEDPEPVRPGDPEFSLFP